MSIFSSKKLNHLMQTMPEHSVVLSSWLKTQGFSDQLIKRYRLSHWLEPIGYGAYQRTGSPATWLGAVYALQKHTSTKIHIGGPTVFAMRGLAQYVSPEIPLVWLFSPNLQRLPKWLRDHDFGAAGIKLVHSTVLPEDKGLETFVSGSLDVAISTPTRAMLECLQLAPHRYSLTECYELMENLLSLRATSVQELLEQCRSVKVVRLFLFMAERAGHAWASRIDVSRLDLGRGKRKLAPHGVYVRKYQLVVPEELA